MHQTQSSSRSRVGDKCLDPGGAGETIIRLQSMSIFGTELQTVPLDLPVKASSRNVEQNTISASLVAQLFGENILAWAKQGTYLVKLEWAFPGYPYPKKSCHLLAGEGTAEVTFAGLTASRRFAAHRSDVRPSVSFDSILAPFSRSSLAMASCPLSAAYSSGVRPPFIDSVLAPLSRGSLTTASCSFSAACSSANLGTSSSWPVFSAPYEQLSESIWKHLESERPIHWKAILRASSQYRSQIPFYAEHNIAPMISSYHAFLLELKFLYSLWPRQEITSLLVKIHHRASFQFDAYKALVQPLYQAYSSLRHGFRRLTDTSTVEFRELKGYLEDSCHPIHGRTLELQDIYRVFMKADLPNPYRDWIEAKEAQDPCGEERLLLWHGTPLDSVLGILDLGLQIRRQGATRTGTMFGNSIYFADASSKSAGFCKHHLRDGQAVLFLCEADVGTQRIRSKVSISNGHEVIKKARGRHRCIEGLGKVGPMGWKGY